MAKSQTPGSRADVILASLRADVLAGRLKPGQRLTFPELCATYSVSVGVLREALVRLVGLGIVRTESNLGFSVMTLAEEDLVGLMTVRIHSEPAFVREAVKNGSMRWEADLVAAHHLLERTPMCSQGALNDGWVSAHAEFHLAFVAGAGNRRMMEATRRLREEADLYRRWYLDVARLGGADDLIAAEHRNLLVAALARNAEDAERLTRDHIERGARSWLRDAAVRSSAAV